MRKKNVNAAEGRVQTATADIQFPVHATVRDIKGRVATAETTANVVIHLVNAKEQRIFVVTVATTAIVAIH